MVLKVTVGLKIKSQHQYLIDQLTEGGIMVLPLVNKSNQYITKVTKIKNKVTIKKFWKVRFVPLLPGVK